MANNKCKINTSPLDSIGMDMDFLTADPAERFDDDSLKIHYLSAQLIRPDAAQPRRVLPERIYWEFHGERLTPAQALREFIQDVQIIARQKGRPFNTILDLLPNPDNEEEETVNFTPEETLLRDLINLAVTIRDDGQVNPLTVVDCSQGVTQLFRIETGERRYWATWLLMDFLPGYQGDGTIPCIIVPTKRASVFRQAKENTSRTGLNAIAMARQAALLILAVHGIHPPENGPINNDFYRQVLDHDLRGKREFTTDILAAMGGIGRRRLSQYKSLMALSDEALELADRHAIDEGKLRPVLQLDPLHHVEARYVTIQSQISLRLHQFKHAISISEPYVVRKGIDSPPIDTLMYALLCGVIAIAHYCMEQYGESRHCGYESLWSATNVNSAFAGLMGVCALAGLMSVLKKQHERAVAILSLAQTSSDYRFIDPESVTLVLEIIQPHLTPAQYKRALERGKYLDLETVAQELLDEFRNEVL